MTVNGLLLFDSDALYHAGRRVRAGLRIAHGQAVDDVLPFEHAAEDGVRPAVERVELLLLDAGAGGEELRAVRVELVGALHADPARPVVRQIGRGLGRVDVAHSSDAQPGRIAGLSDEAVHDTMEGDTVVPTFARQEHEAVHGQWRLLRIQLDDDVALVGGDGCNVGPVLVDDRLRIRVVLHIRELGEVLDQALQVVIREVRHAFRPGGFVHQDEWRAGQSDLDREIPRRLHFLRELARIEIGVELLHVQADLLGIFAQLGAELIDAERRPGVELLEDHVLHLPEFTLRAGGLTGLGRQLRLVVDFGQREVSIDDANVFRVSVFQTLEQRRHRCAVRSLEVAPLDDRHGGRLRPTHPVVRLRLNDLLAGDLLRCRRRAGGALGRFRGDFNDQRLADADRVAGEVVQLADLFYCRAAGIGDLLQRVAALHDVDRRSIGSLSAGDRRWRGRRSGCAA